MVLALAAAAFASGATAPPASALNPVKPVCGVAGLVSGLIGKACTVVQNGGRWVKAGQKLLGGHLGGAVKTALGQDASKAGASATAAIGLAAVVTWVLAGAKVALHATATILGHTTSPQLGTTWFSATYWRVAGISAVLTLPFLFAAAIQALLRSDLTLLVRAAFGYLPLAMLAVGVAAPVTMLLLAAADQLSAVVSSAAGNASTHFLTESAVVLGALAVVSPFIAVFAGLLVVTGAITLWIELLMREAAVYVIVLMLPLAFAAMVWPARRIWAIRAVELLIALILSKFAIVAVLSLGSAALGASAGAGAHGITAAFAAIVLLVMGAFAPWALLRLLPLAEIASSAAGSLRSDTRAGAGPGLELADAGARAGEDWVMSATAQMRRDASDATGASDRGRASETTSASVPSAERASAPSAEPASSTAAATVAQTNGSHVASPAAATDAAASAAPTMPSTAAAPTPAPAPEPDQDIPVPKQTFASDIDIPVLQEMSDPGNEGKRALDLEDAGPPPPDLEPL
jgi:hypothetical protein